MSVARPSTYEARVWKTEKYEGKEVTTHTVRWKVGTRRWKKPFRTSAQAESFRSKLITAVREGEAFDIATGRPVSMARSEQPTMTWYEFACSHVDLKWPDASPNHRRGTADVLTAVTTALLADKMPSDPTKAMAVRSALKNWAFNAPRRGQDSQPAAVTVHLEWVARHSPAIGELADSRLVGAVLASFKINIDGNRAAGRTAAWRRSVFSTALNHAVDAKLLEANPVPALKWKAPKSTEAIDRRVVVNPAQARALLDSVATTPRSGKLLVAFFGSVYYAALRPEEAVELRKANLDLPAEGWGWIVLQAAAPEVDAQWSNSGTTRHESRELKHRAVGETRRVPCPPELTALLHAHLKKFGTDVNGRLFQGERGSTLANVTYMRLWRRARKTAFTEEQCASPLAHRPYDLRHAAVSTWLNGGVAPAQVAAWAGHSVAILLRIYAKCLDGQEGTALRRIEEALK